MGRSLNVAIHQPNYIPWLGFFSKMSQVDTFIILDDAEYSKNSVINRNKVKSANGEVMLTVPVNYSKNSSALISDIEIANPKMLRKHWKTIEMNYRKSPYFELLSPGFETLFQGEYTRLLDINQALIAQVCQILKLEQKIVLSSELAVQSAKSERVVDLVKAVGGQTYVSGFGAESYNDPDLFESAGIALTYSAYEVKPYAQMYGDFIPKLSVLDALFNVGPGARDLL